MTTWIATTQDNKLADKSSEIESTHATSASDLQLDGNEYQALRGFGGCLAGFLCRRLLKRNVIRSSRNCSSRMR